MANLEFRNLAGLDCHLITSDQTPKLAVVLCHGFGAPGDDLVPIGAQLLQRFPSLLEQTLFVFPAGPLSMEEAGIKNGRAWWPIDMEKLQRSIELDEERDLRCEVPAELPIVRGLLLDLVKVIRTETGLDNSQIVLGGFSQGAMAATETALHLDPPPGGLIVLSGTLINEEVWRERMAHLFEVPVVQSHGRFDPILPFALANTLKEIFRDGGMEIEFIDFDGEHAVPPEAIVAAGGLLERLIS